MLIINILIVFIIILLFCQLFLATVQEGFKEGVDDSSCPGLNQIPLLQDQVKTLQDDVAQLKNDYQGLKEVSDSQYKTDTDMNKLNASADPAPEDEDEKQPK